MQNLYTNYLKPGLSGKTVGKGHDVDNGVPEGADVTAFGLLLAKGTIKGRVRLPELGDVVTDAAGIFKYTHIYARREDGLVGVPQYKDGDLVRKGKIYLPAETGQAIGDTLYWQIVEEAGTRFVGFLYPTASGTPANNVDVSSIVRVYTGELNNHSLCELLIW